MVSKAEIIHHIIRFLFEHNETFVEHNEALVEYNENLRDENFLDTIHHVEHNEKLVGQKEKHVVHNASSTWFLEISIDHFTKTEVPVYSVHFLEYTDVNQYNYHLLDYFYSLNGIKSGDYTPYTKVLIEQNETLVEHNEALVQYIENLRDSIKNL